MARCYVWCHGGTVLCSLDSRKQDEISKFTLKIWHQDITYTTAYRPFFIPSFLFFIFRFLSSFFPSPTLFLGSPSYHLSLLSFLFSSSPSSLTSSLCSPSFNLPSFYFSFSNILYWEKKSHSFLHICHTMFRIINQFLKLDNDNLSKI